MEFKTTKLKNTLLKEYYLAIKSLPPLKKSVKAAYAIARTIGKLREADAAFDEKRQELFLIHFGDTVAEASPKLPGWAPFQREVRVLNNLVVEVEYMKFEPSDLNDEAACELTPDQLASILWITEDPAADKKPT